MDLDFLTRIDRLVELSDSYLGSAVKTMKTLEYILASNGLI